MHALLVQSRIIKLTAATPCQQSICPAQVKAEVRLTTNSNATNALQLQVSTVQHHWRAMQQQLLHLQHIGKLNILTPTCPLHHNQHDDDDLHILPNIAAAFLWGKDALNIHLMLSL